MKTFIPILERRYKSSFERFKYPHMSNYINIIQTNKYNCSLNDKNKHKKKNKKNPLKLSSK